MAICFQSNGRSAAVENCGGALLAELAAEAGFPLNMQCGGQGACRGCTVRLGAGRYRIGEKETAVPAGGSLEARACQTVVLSADAQIEIPSRSLLSIGECAAADFYPARKNLFQAAASRAGGLGIAVDLGTTTVAAILVELSTGTILARESAYNRQIEMGTDVAARIALCREIENTGRLRKLLIEKTVFPMIEKLAAQCSRSLENVLRIVFSGNTVMSHLALGFSPLSIGTIPFEPLTRVFNVHTAPELGLTNCPNAHVQTVPAVAGYIGGDIVSDLYVSEPRRDHLEILVDIGTNGEIVLNDHGKLTATATAAGPAFEGAGLLHGARAAAGVMDRIECRPDDSIGVHVIGNRPAAGLCGSAAVDFIATARRTGLLNPLGRLDVSRLKAAGRYVELDGHGMKVHACILSEHSALDEPVMITEFDISQILKAKAAVYAGIRTLLAREGRRAGDIERFVLAGGFAAHLRLPNAITIGLLPELPLEKYDVVGNGSLAGAYAALGSPAVFDEFLRIARQPQAIHLNETGEFSDHFIDALALPNLDPVEFPQTMEGL